MNEKHLFGKPAREDQSEPGQENSDVGNFPEVQMESQPGVFEAGQTRINQPVEELRDVPDDELTRYGDSRPDELDPEGARFVDISEDPRMTTMRRVGDRPEVHREEPEALEASRVDQDDEIVARPAGELFEKEEALLRPRISKKGDESSQL
ncbi:MAG TPA: hypothetical protein VGE01_12875 [Fimbriimonas sp.]